MLRYLCDTGGQSEWVRNRLVQIRTVQNRTIVFIGRLKSTGHRVPRILRMTQAIDMTDADTQEAAPECDGGGTAGVPDS